MRRSSEADTLEDGTKHGLTREEQKRLERPLFDRIICRAGAADPQQKEESVKQFEVGKTYSCRSICDHNCVWAFTVVSRTASTVTLLDDEGEKITKRINAKSSEREGREIVYPLGRYSMCPVLWA